MYTEKRKKVRQGDFDGKRQEVSNPHKSGYHGGAFGGKKTKSKLERKYKRRNA